MLVIENVGLGVARNVYLSLGDDDQGLENLSTVRAEKLKNLSLFRAPIPTLKRHQKVSHFIDMAHSIRDLDNFEITICINWQNYKGLTVYKSHTVSTGFMTGISALGTDPFYEIAKAQREIASQIKTITSLGRLKVTSITEQEEQERRRGFAEQIAPQSAQDEDSA